MNNSPHYNRQNVYNNRNRNRYHNESNTMRHRNDIRRAINTHFDNINILATLVQNSQRLLENQTVEQNPHRVMQSPQQFFIIDTSTFSAAENAEHNSQYSSYITVLVDSSDQSIINQTTNTHLFDVSQYSHISSPMNDVCPITQEEFDPQQGVLVIAQCKHVFNKAALQTWVRSNNTCPSCRCLIRDPSQHV
jgi:hypothetical protein